MGSPIRSSIRHRITSSRQTHHSIRSSLPRVISSHTKQAIRSSINSHQYRKTLMRSHG